MLFSSPGKKSNYFMKKNIKNLLNYKKDFMALNKGLRKINSIRLLQFYLTINSISKKIRRKWGVLI